MRLSFVCKYLENKSKDTDLNMLRKLLPCFLMTYDTYMLQTLRASCHSTINLQL